MAAPAWCANAAAADAGRAGRWIRQCYDSERHSPICAMALPTKAPMPTPDARRLPPAETPALRSVCGAETRAHTRYTAMHSIQSCQVEM